LYTRHQAQVFARSIIESEQYRQTLRERIVDKSLSAAMEALLWYYAYGKPIEQIQMTVAMGQEDLSTLSLEELQERAASLTKALEDAKALDEAIPAQFKAA
jgi:uncharacterized small protein (DUF1192 family)